MSYNHLLQGELHGPYSYPGSSSAPSARPRPRRGLRRHGAGRSPISTPGSSIPGPRPSGGLPLVAAGGKAFFVGYEAGSGAEPWVSDGTPLGTSLLGDLCPGPCSSSPQLLGVLGNGVVIFQVKRDEDGSRWTELWASDGTRQGTRRLSASNQGGPDECGLPPSTPLTASTGAYLLFAGFRPGIGCEPWSTDGTPEGTRMLGDLTADSASSQPRNFIALGGKVYFAATNPGALWQSDGTPAGTRRVTDVAIANAFDGLRLMTAAGSAALLHRSPGWRRGAVDQRRHGRGHSPPHRVPGPRALPQHPAPQCRRRRRLLPGDRGGDRALAQQRHGGRHPAARHGPLHLLRRRGRGEGGDPGRFRDQPAGEPAERAALLGHGRHAPDHGADRGLPRRLPFSSGARRDGAAGRSVLFPATDPRRGTELWSSDGTGAGTRLVRDLCPGACSSEPQGLTVLGGQAWFTAFGGTGSGLGLWRTDGTAAGTVRVATVASRLEAPPVAAGGKVVFEAREGGSPGNPVQIWASDGTAEGTGPVW